MNASSVLRVFSARPPPRINALAASRDATIIAAACDDGSVRVFKTHQPDEIEVITEHTDEVRCVAWSPDGRILASGSNDRTARLTGLDGRQLAVLDGHSDWVRCLAWSPDGQFLAAGLGDGALFVWDIKRSCAVWKERFHQAPIRSLLWSPDGVHIITACVDRTIGVWDAMGGDLEQNFVAHDDAVLSLCWIQDGKYLATASSDRTILIWQYPAMRRTLKMQGHADSILSLSWGESDGTLASASSDGDLRVWNVETGICETIYGPQGISARSVLWLPSKETLVAAYSDCKIRFWNAKSSATCRTIGTDECGVSSIATSAGRIAIGMDSGQVTLIEGDVRPRIRSIDTRSGRVSSIAFSEEEQALVAGFCSGECKIWRWNDGLLQPAVGHRREIRAISIAPLTGRIFSASADRKLILRTFNSPDLSREITCSVEPFLGMTLCSNEKFIAGAMTDPKVYVWDATSGEQRHLLEGHKGSVVGIAASKSGTLLATASTDRTLRIWDMSTGTVMKILQFSDIIRNMAWSDMDRFFAAAQVDGTVTVFETDLWSPLSISASCPSHHIPLHVSFFSCPAHALPPEIPLQCQEISVSRRC